jgi:hypothetical protein
MWSFYYIIIHLRKLNKKGIILTNKISKRKVYKQYLQKTSIIKMPLEGLEPTTYGLQNQRSTIKLKRLFLEGGNRTHIFNVKN